MPTVTARSVGVEEISIEPELPSVSGSAPCRAVPEQKPMLLSALQHWFLLWHGNTMSLLYSSTQLTTKHGVISQFSGLPLEKW
eukprot:s320_g30.t1